MADFLYNGVRLPKIPAAGMAFAFIYYLAGFYDVVFSNSYNLGISRETLKQQVEVPDGNVSYGYLAEYPELGWRKYDSTSARNIDFDNIIWANFDIVNENGTLYLAASDPVPVLNHSVLMQGFMMGDAVKRMRK